MPNYKKHTAVGVIVYTVFLGVVTRIVSPSFITACEWLLFTLAGALFPDIDIKSKGQKYFYYVIFILLFILAINKQFTTITCSSFIIIIPMLVRHRGIFHRSWFIISMPIGIWLLTSLFFPCCTRSLFYDTLFFIVGALSHIVLDYGIMRVMTHFFMSDQYRKNKHRY